VARWQRFASGVVLGVLGLAAGDMRRSAGPPVTRESATEQLLEQVKTQYAQNELFDLEKIEQVDMIQKRVVVVYDIDRHPEAMPFRKHRDDIFENVREFYKGHGISIQFTRNLPFYPEKNRILLRVLDEDEYIATVPSPEIINRRSAGHAESRERIVYFKAWASDKEFEQDSPGEFVSVSSDTLAHEIAHMFALTHVDDGEAAGYYPNLMEKNYRGRQNCFDTGTLCSSITLTQAVLIHDYLSGGRTYRAFLEAGQDPKEYSLRCKSAQNARESIKRLELIIDSES